MPQPCVVVPIGSIPVTSHSGAPQSGSHKSTFPFSACTTPSCPTSPPFSAGCSANATNMKSPSPYTCSRRPRNSYSVRLPFTTISTIILITLADSFLFLFLSMIIVAASLYLPEHISSIMRRVCFYWGGDEAAAMKSGISGMGSSITEAASDVFRSGNGDATGDPGIVLQRLGEL